MSISRGNDRNFQRSLMEKGVYPENVPPLFRVRHFFRVCDRRGLLSSDQIVSKKPTRLSRYNETKRGGQRRIFSTPNPLFFIDAARYFTTYRKQFDKHLRKSSFSRSVPMYRRSNDRFIQIETHSDFTRFRRMQLSSSRYIVKTDIARFYPSIYTHSIPWAVHGKGKAKNNRNPRSTKYFANKLDYLIRQAQDQQTIGIPVGPDTSRIVSELIVGAVDKQFAAQIGRDVPGARLVDDIYLGAANLDEAEDLLSTYRDCLRQFELDINEGKTKIFEARFDLEPFWPVDIRREVERFAESDGTNAAKNDLVAYLDQVIRIANQESDDGIIKYAIRRMDQARLWEEYWDAVEAFLIKVAIVFPHCVDYVARVVIWYNRRFGLDSERWGRVCETILAYHSRLGNDSEIVWPGWLLKEIDQSIHKSLCEDIIRRCGPYSVLVVLDLFSEGLVSGRFPKNLIYERIGEHPMIGDDWLLAYEAERSFELRVKAKNRNDYGAFGELIDGGAEFYNKNAVPVVFEGIRDFTRILQALEDQSGLYEDNEG